MGREKRIVPTKNPNSKKVYFRFFSFISLPLYYFTYKEGFIIMTKLERIDELSIDVFVWAEEIQKKHNLPLMTPIIIDYIHHVKYLILHTEENKPQEWYRSTAKTLTEKIYSGEK